MSKPTPTEWRKGAHSTAHGNRSGQTGPVLPYAVVFSSAHAAPSARPFFGVMRRSNCDTTPGTAPGSVLSNAIVPASGAVAPAILTKLPVGPPGTIAGNSFGGCTQCPMPYGVPAVSKSFWVSAIAASLITSSATISDVATRAHSLRIFLFLARPEMSKTPCNRTNEVLTLASQIVCSLHSP